MQGNKGNLIGKRGNVRPLRTEVPAGRGKGDTARFFIDEPTSPGDFNKEPAVDNRILPLPAGPGYSHRPYTTYWFIVDCVKSDLYTPDRYIISRATDILLGRV